ncbi:ATP-dependent zinc metalloprotease FtsH [Sedimentibacter sp. zth1]|uniref:ATP-dependent zinc metalloprotease FtsH n=1 Tax=Sedimentibacter sp. zth1 TaxID=2816908 RepID=UPI001A90F391|nr:ATP-dependent zinc metalloprotease FtsH [Sedimentibacter sp. zth1]
MKGFAKSVAIYVLIFALIIVVVNTLVKPMDKAASISYSQLVTELESGNIKTIKFVENDVTGTFRDDKAFRAYIPNIIIFTSNFYDKYISDQVEGGIISVEGEPVPKTSFFFQALPTIGMVILLGVFWFIIMRQSQGGGSGKAMSFGKSRAKLNKEDNPDKIVKFADVAGLEEEKEELIEIVEFLKNPAKYTKLGARIPTGLLMVGPPGTGKTYLSKAVAGEAGVPFFSISGSDFVEMFVGVGASRVRDLFEQAKKNAPCIVFIDEIDAVGRKRGAGLGGGNDEREQTLNQLLVEMDGFGANEGIIVIAATNRPDVLDPALLRPGRFDRQVRVGVPDLKARVEILKVHCRKKPIEEDVDLEVIARRIPGFTPADIENLMNESALLAARQNLSTIPMQIIEDSITKVIAGPEKKSKIISEKEKKLTAYHEAGHAVVARLSSNLDPVHMVTIIPRGGAGGFTWYLPKEDRSYASKSEMQENIVRLLGGRVAEKLILDDISTGASNDIERATRIARDMVTVYGMTDALGPINYGQGDDEVFIGRDFNKVKNYSEEIAAKIDYEVRAIVDKAYNRAIEILDNNTDKLDKVAKSLLEKETISGKEFEELMTEC